MKESVAQKLAKLLQLVRGLEADIGIVSLSKTERVLFTSIADLSALNNQEVEVRDIVAHPDLKNMPLPTIYKCLRDLHSKGLLEKVGTQRLGLYKLG
jgi:hypothetical protein